jgi:hypothetical protein
VTQRILACSVCLAVIAASAAAEAGAAVVRCDMPAGKVAYQDKPCPDGSKATVVQIAPLTPAPQAHVGFGPVMLPSVIGAPAQHYGSGTVQGRATSGSARRRTEAGAITLATPAAARKRTFDERQSELARGFPSMPTLRERDPARYLAETETYLERGEKLVRTFSDVQAVDLFRRDLVHTGTTVASWVRFTLRDPARAEGLYRRAISLQSGLPRPLADADTPRFWLADLLRFDLQRPEEALVEYRAMVANLNRRTTPRDSPDSAFERAAMQWFDAEIEYLDSRQRFSEPLDPTSFVVGQFVIEGLARGIGPGDPAVAELWVLLRNGAPGAAERRQAASRLEALSASNLRIAATFDFLPSLGSAEQVAAYLRRHDPSGFQSAVAFAVARAFALQTQRRQPAPGEGMSIATWTEQDRALMLRAEALVVTPAKRSARVDARLASPEVTWRGFLAALRASDLAAPWRFTTPAFQRRNRARFGAMSPAERAAWARLPVALDNRKESGDYVFAEVTRPDGGPGNAAFVRYRGEWLLADL